MEYTRWYDVDKRLQIIVKTLESIDDELKFNTAMDLIQMILVNKAENSDELIAKINSVPQSKSSRWYDKNETIQFAVEILKYTDDVEREELLQEILYELMSLNDNEKGGKPE